MNVSRIHPAVVSLKNVENGTVFRVVAPKIEGRNNVKNDGMYRKEADSHCVQLGNNKDVILARDTLVRVVPNSRFANAAAMTA